MKDGGKQYKYFDIITSRCLPSQHQVSLPGGMTPQKSATVPQSKLPAGAAGPQVAALQLPYARGSAASPVLGPGRGALHNHHLLSEGPSPGPDIRCKCLTCQAFLRERKVEH